MKGKLQNLGQYFQEYSQYARDSLNELIRHPLSIPKALADLVKNYWDVGVVVASAFAVTPAGNDFYNGLSESYRTLDLTQKLKLAFFSGFTGAVGGTIRDSGGFKNFLIHLMRGRSSPQDPFLRNFYAGLTTYLIGVDIGAEDPRLFVEVGMKITEAMAFAGFIVSDNARWNAIVQNSTSNSLNLEDSIANSSQPKNSGQ